MVKKSRGIMFGSFDRGLTVTSLDCTSVRALPSLLPLSFLYATAAEFFASDMQ